MRRGEKRKDRKGPLEQAWRSRKKKKRKTKPPFYRTEGQPKSEKKKKKGPDRSFHTPHNRLLTSRERERDGTPPSPGKKGKRGANR